MHRLRIRIICMFACVLLFIGCIPLQQANAAAMKLYYHSTKKTVSYTDKQVMYVYNGTSISLPGTPGILTENGVALGPYYDIFSKALGVTCKKNSSDNTITFTKGNNKLVLTLNSTTAVLNGTRVTMNAAPVSIRYVDAKKSRILVPTRFVAESLGFFYSWDSASSTVTIKSSLTLFYNNKQVSYNGTIGAVTVDGKSVSISKLPTILMSNTAMLRAYTVFKKAMGVSYSYNQSTGKITFRKGDIRLVMQENSTIAYLNDLIVDCGIAPVLVRNTGTNTEALLVPGRFVAEALGYDYTWNAETKTSEIVTTDKVGVYVPPEIEEEIPVDQVLYSFIVDENKYLDYENSINNAATEIIGDIPLTASGLTSVHRDNNEIYNEKYILQFTSPVNTLTSELKDGLLTVTIPNTVCGNRVYNNFYGTLATSVLQEYDSQSSSTRLIFSLSTASPYYGLELSEDGTSAEITIYPNYLVGMELGHNQYGNYMRLKGIQSLQYEQSIENGYNVITLKNTANTLGNLLFPDEYFDQYFNHAVMVETDPDQIKLIYKTENDIELLMQEQANELYLYFDYSVPEQEGEGDQTLNTPISVILPDGVDFNSITTRDEYLNKKFIITIPGDFNSYYQMNPILNTYAAVENLSVSVSGGNTLITLTTSRIQGFVLDKSRSGFQITVGNPSDIYDKIIVLDAGHGGIDPGASAGGYNEKDINFTILNNYTNAYFENSGIKVYFTRLTDVKIDLYERADFATQVEADMFVSLHMNAFSTTSVNGTAVYYSTLNNSINSGRLTSKIMAEKLVNNLSAALGTKNNGIKTANFVVIKETQVPAVLIELAFITNASDRKIITTTSTQKIAARTIYESVVNFFQVYPTGR